MIGIKRITCTISIPYSALSAKPLHSSKKSECGIGYRNLHFRRGKVGGRFKITSKINLEHGCKKLPKHSNSSKVRRIPLSSSSIYVAVMGSMISFPTTSIDNCTIDHNGT